MNDAAQGAALAEWAGRLAAKGYEGVRERYFGPVVQEFFEYGGKRYEVTTEAVWDRGIAGDLRVFIEISDASEPAPRKVLARDLILSADPPFVGEAG
jgi:hypothetical protein